jgi:hypothetical protein
MQLSECPALANSQPYVMPHPDSTRTAIETKWFSKDSTPLANNGGIQWVLSRDGKSFKHVVDYKLIVCIFSNHFNT